MTNRDLRARLSALRTGDATLIGAFTVRAVRNAEGRRAFLATGPRTVQADAKRFPAVFLSAVNCGHVDSRGAARRTIRSK